MERLGTVSVIPLPAPATHVARGIDGGVHIGIWQGRFETCPRWHSTDARDRLVDVGFDEDLRDDAVMTAMFAYLASRDPKMMPRTRRTMPEGLEWPRPSALRPLGAGKLPPYADSPV